MLRSIDFKTMPYLFTDKAGTCLTVEFDGRELDDIYKQVKAMYDQAHSSDDMPTEPGWYATRDGEDLLSYDGDAWHIHRLPVIKASQTEKYHESRKVRTTLTVYRLQCPRGHISTSWFSHAALASRQWKELVDEYKGKDTK